MRFTLCEWAVTVVLIALILGSIFTAVATIRANEYKTLNDDIELKQ